MGRIILIPYGGLGNRMRSIDSALNFKRRYDSLSIIWAKEKGMNCDWEDIFEPLSYIKSKRPSKIIRFIIQNRKRFHHMLDFSEKCRIFRYVDIYDGNSESIDSLHLNRRPMIMIIRSCVDFCRNDSFHNEVFLIHNQDFLKKELNKIDGNTVGVHIRRTDNKVSINQSPLNLFENAIRNDLLRNPRYQFYLCSDDQSVKEYFKQIFGNSIITPTGIIDRNSSTGIIQAASEMKALSSCQWIYGSYGSSFAEVAARLGGIENRLLHKTDV